MNGRKIVAQCCSQPLNACPLPPVDALRHGSFKISTLREPFTIVVQAVASAKLRIE